jgi:signal transduction histidine kinase
VQGITADETEKATVLDQLRRHAVRDRAIALLARDAAHDLKGALNIVAMNVDLLARAARDPASSPMTAEQAERSAAALQRQLRRIDRTIDAVLGAGETDGAPQEPFDLTTVVEPLLELAAGRASRQRVEIAFEQRGPARLSGDPVHLQSAVLALLVNALEAMPDGGRLDVTVSASPPSVTITDTGAGVPPDRVATMWEPGVSTKPGAPGLGLTVARAVVGGHGGSIRYAPNPAGGSTFAVELPTSGRTS